ncbi:MAG: AI-2E family transporter [Actinomycetota bacterium]|nr:AI-2E family transporter [Actinomycetota bacterium]
MSSPAPPRLPASERLRRVGLAAWSLIGILIVTAFALWGLLRIRIIFPPLILAVLIIYTLNPVVAWLERRRIPRLAGTLIAYVVVLGGISILIALLVPLVSRQVEQVSDHWPEYRAEIVTFVDDTAQSVEDRFGTEINTSQVACLLGAEEASTETISEARCDEVTEDFREALANQADRITEIGSSVLEALLVFIIGPLLALYLLIDLPHLQRDAINLVPEAHREEVRDLASKVGLAVGGFFRGQLVVALLVGTLSAFGFWLIDLPFWFLIGAIAGFFNLIPLVGPYIGGAIGFFIGIIAQGIGLGLKAALVELVVQQIDNHIISPNVMRRTVNLHPVTVMLSILAGGALAGFWGVLLGVPAMAVVKLLLGHVWSTRVLGAPVSPASEKRSPVPVAPPVRAGPDRDSEGEG